MYFSTFYMKCLRRTSKEPEMIVLELLSVHVWIPRGFKARHFSRCGAKPERKGKYVFRYLPPARGRCAAKRSLPPTLLARSRGKKMRFQGEADFGQGHPARILWTVIPGPGFLLVVYYLATPPRGSAGNWNLCGVPVVSCTAVAHFQTPRRFQEGQENPCSQLRPPHLSTLAIALS